MVNKGKKKQKKHLHSVHLPPHTSQIQHQKAHDLKYQVQENLEQCFVDWDELPEAEQEEILEGEIKLAEEALDRAETEAHLARLSSMDPDASQQASLSTLPSTNPRDMEMTKEEVRQAIGALSTLISELTDCILHLTSQVTLMVANVPATAAATVTSACPKTKDKVKRPES